MISREAFHKGTWNVGNESSMVLGRTPGSQMAHKPELFLNTGAIFFAVDGLCRYEGRMVQG